MSTSSFGKKINHGDAKDYFDRYIAIKKKHGDKLREFLKDDPEAQRFFCGRKDQNPAFEDWAYVFDQASLKRLLDLITSTQANSLVIFQGTRDLEQGDPADESNGRPTLLVFPATFKSTKDQDGEFIIADEGEEHPGSGGTDGTISAGATKMEFPRVIKLGQIHKVLKL